MQFAHGPVFVLAGGLAGWAIALVGLLGIGFLFFPYTSRFKLDVRCSMICGQCGYDLTGNVSGTCPECGTMAAQNPKDRDSRT
jgi:hypothetical protein